MFDGRPNGELFMATGRLQTRNPSDYLTIEVWALPWRMLNCKQCCLVQRHPTHHSNACAGWQTAKRDGDRCAPVSSCSTDHDWPVGIKPGRQKEDTCRTTPSQASLVAADRLYGIKKDILDSIGFTNPQVRNKCGTGIEATWL